MLDSSPIDEIKKNPTFEVRLKLFVRYRIQTLDTNSDLVLNYLLPTADQKILNQIEYLIEDSDFCCHADIKPYASTLIWLYSNFIINYWFHDKTNQKIKTTHLIDTLTPIVLKPIYMSRFSFATSAVQPVVHLLKNFIKIN